MRRAKYRKRESPTIKELAHQFGVTAKTIQDVVGRKGWSHVVD